MVHWCGTLLQPRTLEKVCNLRINNKTRMNRLVSSADGFLVVEDVLVAVTLDLEYFKIRKKLSSLKESDAFSQL